MLDAREPWSYDRTQSVLGRLVGGLDLGVERAGFEVVSQCEKLDYRRQVLRRHWPDTEISDDVESVSYPKDSTDLLFGGFPCQDLSVAGRREGLDGSRSGLFFEFARIADECVRPGGWILIENVPGLLSSKQGRDFAVLLRTLADIGFRDCAWRVLDSRYVRVPQRRRRVFILARRAEGQRAAKVLLEPEGDGGHPEEGRKARKDRAAAASGGARTRRRPALAGGGEGEALGFHARHLTIEEVAQTIAGGGAKENGGSPSLNDASLVLHTIPVGLGRDATVAGTLGKKGEGGGGFGLDREGGLVVGVLGTHAHTLTSEGMDASEDGTGRGTPVVTTKGFNWQSGGDIRFQYKDGEVPTLQTEQVPAIHTPSVAAPLTKGSATGDGVSVPGRRREDDENVVAFNLRGREGDSQAEVDPEGVAVMRAGSGGSSRTYVSITSADEFPTVRTNWRNNSNPTTESDMLVARETSPAVTRKWEKGSGGPSGDETQNMVLFNPFRTSLGKGEGYVEGWKRDEIHDAMTAQNPPKGRPVVVPERGSEHVVRRLSPTECERLQGFPDGWTLLGDGLGSLAGEASWYELERHDVEDGVLVRVPRCNDRGYLDALIGSMILGIDPDEEPKPDGRRYAAMGDAVTVPVAEWIGRRILDYGQED